MINTDANSVTVVHRLSPHCPSRLLFSYIKTFFSALIRLVLIPTLLVGFIMSCASLANCRIIVEDAGYYIDDDLTESLIEEARPGVGMFKWGFEVSEGVMDTLDEHYGDNRRYDDDDWNYYRHNDDWADALDREIRYKDFAVGKVCIGYPTTNALKDAAKEVNEHASSNIKLGSALAARGFAVLATLMGCIAFAGMATTFLFVSKGVKAIWWIGRGALPIAIFGQAMTFLLFDSDFCTNIEASKYIDCQFGPGAILSVMALLFYLSASVLSFFVLAPLQPLCVLNRNIGELAEGEVVSLKHPGSGSEDPESSLTKGDEERSEAPGIVQAQHLPAATVVPENNYRESLMKSEGDLTAEAEA